jgi:hypothetical protein
MVRAVFGEEGTSVWGAGGVVLWVSRVGCDARGKRIAIPMASAAAVARAKLQLRTV